MDTMRVLAPPHRIRVARRGAPVTAPATIERTDIAPTAPLVDLYAPRLDLTPDVIEELLRAVGDREDMVGPDARARLARGRAALERELVRQ